MMNALLIPKRYRSPLRYSIVFFCALLWVAPAAGQKVQLSLSPMRVDIDQLKAGDFYTDALGISNNSDESQHVVVWAADWRLTADGGVDFLRAGSLPDFSCGGWITVNPTEFDLAPLKGARLRYTFRVPNDAAQRGYHCALVVQNTPRPSEAGSGPAMRTQLRLVTTFYATVGNPVAQPRVESLTIAPETAKGQSEDAPAGLRWAVQLTLANAGETNCRGEGTIRVLDASGQTLKTFSLDSSPILPKSERRFSWSLPEKLIPGDYRLQASLDLGLKAVQEIEKNVTLSAPGTSRNQ